MTPIQISEVKNIYDYEKVRDRSRQEIIGLKKRRRVQVGKRLSFLFENRATVLFQIQEMCRAERIVDDAKVQEEIDVYNELIPASHQLSATMMIEIEDSSEVQPVLDSLMGIDSGEHVWIQVGKEYAIPGQFETGRSDGERGKLSAVHFVRLEFSREAIKAFRTEDVHLVVDHPGEKARTRILDEVKAALVEDLES
ncbi:MAG TPA: DUF3501 family protein [Methylomirabilota bacterium]|nr:DUF3501 family protein [Methylomirabilota bacterium]